MVSQYLKGKRKILEENEISFVSFHFEKENWIKKNKYNFQVYSEIETDLHECFIGPMKIAIIYIKHIKDYRNEHLKQINWCKDNINIKQQQQQKYDLK